VYTFAQRHDAIDPPAKRRHIDLGTLDAVSRARHPSDIIDATLGCMAAHGLRSSSGELRGDEIVMLALAMSVPDDDAVPSRRCSVSRSLPCAFQWLPTVPSPPSCSNADPEEFLVVLRDCDAVGALRRADAFRSRLGAVQLPQSCMPRGPLTVSAGIAVLPDNGSVLTDLVRAADVAMYKAKRAGGDRHQLSAHSADARPAKRSHPVVRGAA
jgi:Diguanylate cyclase, GGDEF domain